MAMNHKQYGQEIGIECQIEPGMFDGERIARFCIETRQGPQTVEGFFDDALIEEDPDRPGCGWLRAAELDRRKGLVLVLLPGTTNKTNQKVVIKEEMVRQPA